MNGRNLSLTLGTVGLLAVAALGLTADLRNTTEIDPAGCLQSASSSPCNRKLARYYDDVYGQHVEADRENSLVTSMGLLRRAGRSAGVQQGDGADAQADGGRVR
ncbi:TPA: hypothetical protein SMR42_004210 [Pseudomonas putida]|nr:hypothetical protein [Pseudomonas putida]